jgi:hypothetical protein
MRKAKLTKGCRANDDDDDDDDDDVTVYIAAGCWLYGRGSIPSTGVRLSLFFYIQTGLRRQTPDSVVGSGADSPEAKRQSSDVLCSPLSWGEFKHGGILHLVLLTS